MMEYILRIRLHNGSFADLPFRALSFGMAVQIAESQFGRGSFMGCISETYLNTQINTDTLLIIFITFIEIFSKSDEFKILN